MARSYTSKVLASLHEAVSDSHDAGLVDRKTMREFDETCLTPVEQFSGDEIAAIRDREGVSQAVLARHLNVAPKLVGEWERGEKRPSGPSLKLLALAKAKGLSSIL